MNVSSIEALCSPESRQFMAKHQNADPAALALRARDRSDIPVRDCIEQITCRKKAEQKLPFLKGTDFLFEKTALEQSSGHRTAEYKAVNLSGNMAIDLTAGLGIDAIFLSRSFTKVHACESNPVLAAILRCNLKLLGIGNVEVHEGNGAEILESFADSTFDWIYADPSRRDENRRYVDLSDASPSLPGLENLLMRKAARVCIKASPAYDLAAAEKSFGALVAEEAVSVDGECKELLLMLENSDCRTDRPVRRAALLSSISGELRTVESSPRNVPAAILDHLPRHGEYILDPDASIVKMRLTDELAATFQAQRPATNVEYLATAQKPSDFPGRTFQVIETIEWSRRTLKRYLRAHGIAAASVTRRDFPISPERFRKDFGLAHDPRVFLICTKIKSLPFVIHCRRL